MRKVLVLSAVAAAVTISVRAQDQQAVVNRYCLGCHNEKLKSGNFSWQKIDLAHVDQSAEQAERAIRMLHAGMMPPPGLPRPDAAGTNALVSYLENSIDRAAGVRPFPGAPALHRLNRNEYQNSIRDLLGLDVDVASLLPADDMSHGFDNMADVLRVSPALMEGYIRAGDRISREAVGDRQVSADHQDLSHPARGESDAARGRNAVRNARRHVGDPRFSGRRRIRVPAVALLRYLRSAVGQESGQGPADRSFSERRARRAGDHRSELDVHRRSRDRRRSKSRPDRKNVSASFIPKAEGPVEDVVMPYRAEPDRFQQRRYAGPDQSLPHLREMRIVGPDERHRDFGNAQPPENFHLPSGCAGRRDSLREKNHRRAGAPGLSPSGDRCRPRRSAERLSAFPQPARISKPESARWCRPSSPIPNLCSASSAPPRRSRPARTIASAIWNWPRACLIFCGAARRTMN